MSDHNGHTQTLPASFEVRVLRQDAPGQASYWQVHRVPRERDECRGAHFKPEFAPPGIAATDPVERRRLAEAWCDEFEKNMRRWLKSTIAVLDSSGEPQLSYEDVDTSLVPPRPRLYGLVGAEMIEQVWDERQRAKPPAMTDGNGAATIGAKAATF